MEKQGKPVIYQVFTRLFGNTKTANKPWGTIEDNGVGKFNDFTDKALAGIKELGVTHIWYTGALHHGVIRDYTKYGIENDDPDIVKGRAGSPYAIKDYYNVNPDLAVDPANRLQEFKALVERSHKHHLKVIIDIVPNHIARNYKSISAPEGVEDFGTSDNTSVEYSKHNNFYYIVGKAFEVPDNENGYLPLGGEPHPLADGKFNENPAKWTGNGSRSHHPKLNDWFETVKVNYGVCPDGSYDFDRLPADYANKDYQAHYRFWQGKDVPNSWVKFRQIVEYWSDFGIDGFRYDMAEMVPVEFWSYLNSSIKMKNPDAVLIAEIYQPKLYRDFIHLGKTDFLYDKVDFYDTTKAIMQGKEKASRLIDIQNTYADIEQHLMHFLENHDEQRIASKPFAGNANVAKPAMVVSATMSRSPTLIYFGQEVGEPGDGDAGFGDPTRTTIYDYWGVPSHQRWMNNGKFDGSALSDNEKQLRDFYVRLMNLTANHKAFTGEYAELHRYNLANTQGYNERVISYARWYGDEKLIVIANYDTTNSYEFELKLPGELVDKWQIKNKTFKLKDLLYKEYSVAVNAAENPQVRLSIKPLQSFIFKLEQ